MHDCALHLVQYVYKHVGVVIKPKTNENWPILTQLETIKGCLPFETHCK